MAYYFIYLQKIIVDTFLYFIHYIVSFHISLSLVYHLLFISLVLLAEKLHNMQHQSLSKFV